MDQRRLELGLRSETIRRANLSAIVRALHVDGPLSRSELGTRTGLTRSAIRVLIGELTATGLVEERAGRCWACPAGHRRSSGCARIARSSWPSRSPSTTCAAAVVGLGGDVLRTARIERPRSRVASGETIADLARLARGLGTLPTIAPRARRAARRHRSRLLRHRAAQRRRRRRWPPTWAGGTCPWVSWSAPRSGRRAA